MENKPEPLDFTVSKMKTVFQEFGETISQTLEVEKKKLIEEAEEEAKKIIARANEEASKFIVQTRREAEIESNKFLDKIKEEAEQILKNSREQVAEEARQEFYRINSEAREKSLQIISKAIEKDITQIRKEHYQASAEAKNKLESETSHLFMTTKNIEQIITDTQTNMAKGIENLVSIIMETGNQLQSLYDESNEENGKNMPQVPGESITIEAIETLKSMESFMGSPQLTQEAVEIEHVETLENQEITENPPVAINEAVTELPIKPEELKTTLNLTQITEKTVIEPGKKPEEPDTEHMVPEGTNVKTGNVTKLEKPPYIEIWLKDGINLLDKGKTEEALGVLKRVVKADPENGLAWRKLGTALGMQGRLMESLNALRKAIDLVPDDITTWHNTEIVLRKLGRKDEAKKAKETEKRLIKQYPEQYKAAKGIST